MILLGTGVARAEGMVYLSGSLGLTALYQGDLNDPARSAFSLAGDYRLGLGGPLVSPRLGSYQIGLTARRWLYSTGVNGEGKTQVSGYDLSANLFPQGRLRLSLGTHADYLGRSDDWRTANVESSFFRAVGDLPQRIALDYFYSANRTLSYSDPLSYEPTEDQTVRRHSLRLGQRISLPQAELELSSEAALAVAADNLHSEEGPSWGETWRLGVRSSFPQRPGFLSTLEAGCGYERPLEKTQPAQDGLAGGGLLPPTPAGAGHWAGARAEWEFTPQWRLQQVLDYREEGRRWGGNTSLRFDSGWDEPIRRTGQLDYAFVDQSEQTSLHGWAAQFNTYSRRNPALPLTWGVRLAESHDPQWAQQVRSYSTGVSAGWKAGDFQLSPGASWRRVETLEGAVLADEPRAGTGLTWSHSWGRAMASISTGATVDREGARMNPSITALWNYFPREGVAVSANYTGRSPLARPQDEVRPTAGLNVTYRPRYDLDLSVSYLLYNEGSTVTGQEGAYPAQKYTVRLRCARRGWNVEVWGEHRQSTLSRTETTSARFRGHWAFRAVDLELNAGWTAPGLLSLSLGVVRTF